MVQALFEQLSTQLNFLLLSQRNMIIVSAFSVALATFAHNTKNANFKWLSLMLFVYSLAVGITAAVDFNNYITDTKNDNVVLEDDEMRMINRSQKWIYFTYAQVAIISFLIVAFIRY